MLKLYVATVAALAVTAAVVAAETVHVADEPSVAVLVLMGLLLWLTEFLQVRQYHYRGHGVSINLLEGVLAPLVFAASGAQAALVAGLAIGAAEVFRRNGFLKTLFNTCQWVLAAAVGQLVLHAISSAHPNAGRGIAAVAAAVVTMSVVNQVTITAVMLLAVRAADEEQSLRQLLSGVVNRLVSNGAALITGLTLVAAYSWSPWLLGVGAAFVLGLDRAGRAHASLRADRIRLEGLQRATHALATSLEPRQAIPTLLAEARVGFEMRSVQLVLFVDGRMVVHTCTGSASGGYDVETRPHRLAELLAWTLEGPAHLSVESAEADVSVALAAAGHTRALAVPLRSPDATLGLLLLFDRIGVEGFEAGELSVAGALARELVGFLARVDLMHAIDEERRKLADIVESTSDGILTIDSDGVVTSWNTGLAEMTGYAPEEMVGTRHVGLLRARDGSGRDVLVERWLTVIESGASLPAELQVVSAGGQTLWLSCSYSRIPASEGRRDVLVVVARNITQARELERLKDDFVAVVSHELRTPLVPIKGWAQTLINRGDRLSDDQRRTAVQSILAQAQKLESLVLNILEASRIEAGRVDGDGVSDVAAVVMRIVDDTLAARPDRTVRVRPPSVPCQVRGSSVWVERAVSNLVANAIKYSPDDEPVDVAVSVDGADVVVTVTDRGPGIALDGQERIFDRFERLEESRKQTGTGLGLYITRRLARAMGGDVSVSSVPGAGSTFLLRLPLAPMQQATLPEPRTGENDKSKPNDSSDSQNVVNLR